MGSKENICWLAEFHGWVLFDEQDGNMVRFRKQNYVINIWVTKMTVAIVAFKDQFFYKKQTETTIEKIFMNPKKYAKHGN